MVSASDWLKQRQAAKKPTASLAAAPVEVANPVPAGNTERQGLASIVTETQPETPKPQTELDRLKRDYLKLYARVDDLLPGELGRVTKYLFQLGDRIRKKDPGFDLVQMLREEGGCPPITGPSEEPDSGDPEEGLGF